MANLTGLANIVAELRAERTNLVIQLRHVDAALTVLGKLPGGSSYTRPRRTLSATARKRISAAQKARWANRASGGAGGAARPARPKRTMSVAARRRIAAAQRARWAKQKSAAQSTPGNPRPKRRISAAGIARIREAAKARWARVRAEKKK